MTPPNDETMEMLRPTSDNEWTGQIPTNEQTGQCAASGLETLSPEAGENVRSPAQNEVLETKGLPKAIPYS